MLPPMSRVYCGLVLAIPNLLPTYKLLAKLPSPILVIAPPFEKLVNEAAFCAKIRLLPPIVRRLLA